MPETIVEVDAQRRVVYVNRPESPAFTGVAQIGDSIADLLAPDSAEVVLDMIRNAEVTGGAMVEIGAGNDLYRVTAKPLTTGPFTALVFNNITGIRSAGQAIVDLVRDRSAFLEAVSKELRTPLTAVVGYANLLSEPGSVGDESTRRDLVRGMTDQAWDLAGIVEDLLTVASAELGELILAKVGVNIGANVAQVLESMGTRSEDIEVTPRSEVIGTGDPARFRQIVRNLLSNAVRHGEPPVSVAIGTSGEMATVEVRDRGEGLPEELADMLGRHNREGTSATPGTLGLGLWICHELTGLMGGMFSYGREGGETVFQVELPMN